MLDRIAALRRTTLFKELDDETLRSIANRAVSRSFHKDEVLFIAGETALGLYVIVSGSVRRVCRTEPEPDVTRIPPLT